MDNADQDRGQPIGLDIGTSRIVVARNIAQNIAQNIAKKPQFEAQLNAFITLPYSELTEQLLVRETSSMRKRARSSSYLVTTRRSSPRYFTSKPGGPWSTVYSIVMNRTVSK